MLRCSSPTWSVYDDFYSEADDLPSVPPEQTLKHAAKKMQTLHRGTQSVVYLATLIERLPGASPSPSSPVVIKRLINVQSGMFGDGMSETIVREVQILRWIARARSSQSTEQQEEDHPQAAAANDGHVTYGPLMLRKVPARLVQCTTPLLGTLAAPNRELCLVLEHSPLELSSLCVTKAKRGRDVSATFRSLLVGSPHRQDLIRHVVYELLSTVSSLHQAGIVHRDLKPSNVFFNSEGRIQLADFGSAKILSTDQSSSSTRTGTQEEGCCTPAARRTTPQYRAPEAFLGASKTAQLAVQDAWAIGVIFGELLQGKQLFTCRGEFVMLSKIFELLGPPTAETWPELASEPIASTMEFQPSCAVFEAKFRGLTTPAGMELLSSLLHVNPARRCTVSQALSHSYFQEGNTTAACVTAAGSSMEDFRKAKWQELWNEFLHIMKSKVEHGNTGGAQSARMRLALAEDEDETDEEEGGSDEDDDVSDPFF